MPLAVKNTGRAPLNVEHLGEFVAEVHPFSRSSDHRDRRRFSERGQPGFEGTLAKRVDSGPVIGSSSGGVGVADSS
jgi:hypothetical protein